MKQKKQSNHSRCFSKPESACGSKPTATAEKKSAGTFVKEHWLLFVLLVSTVLVYANSLHTPFLFDDLPRIVRNPDITKTENLAERLIYPHEPGAENTYYRNDPSRPVVFLTYTLNYAIGGLKPFGYHATNLLIHLVNIFLLYLLLMRMLSWFPPKECRLYSFIVAALFALHPVNVDAVTYAFGRSSLLEAMFYLSSLLFYMASAKSFRFYAISILCFVLALFSKQSAITLPAVLFLLDFLASSELDWKILRKRLFWHVPYWTIAAAFLAFRSVYFGSIGDIEAGTEVLQRWPYVLSQPGVILKYLGLLIVPIGLNIFHNIPKPLGAFDPRFLVSLAVPMLGALAFGYICRKSKILFRVYVFCLGWFLITISPTTSIFPTTQPMVERRLYLPEIGIFLLLVLFLHRVVLPRIVNRIKIKNVAIVVALVLAVLGGATFSRNRLYRDPELVWKDSIVKSAEFHAPAAKHLAYVYIQKRDYEKAVEHFTKVLDHLPNDFDAHNALGILYKDTKVYDKALAHMKMAFALKPHRWGVLADMGIVYGQMGNYEMAIKEFNAALRQNPGNEQMRQYLGIMYAQNKDFENALLQFNQILERHPGNSQCLYSIGMLYFNFNQPDSAKVYFQQILRDEPYNRAARHQLQRIENLPNKQE